MTAIYDAIMLKLWQKDILALRIPCKHREVYDLLEFKIKNLIPHEINLTEVLAFIGLCSDIIEFKAEVQKQIYN